MPVDVEELKKLGNWNCPWCSEQMANGDPIENEKELCAHIWMEHKKQWQSLRKRMYRIN